MVRTICIATLLPMFLWDELARTAVQFLNQAPTDVLSQTTPDQALADAIGKPIPVAVSYANIKAPGQAAYVHIPDAKWMKGEKLVPRAIHGHLIGYEGVVAHDD